MKSIAPFAFVVALLLVISNQASAASAQTPPFHITGLQTGWYGEGLVIGGGGNISGYSGNNEHGVQLSNSQYRDIVTLASSAYLAGKNVVLVCDTASCAFGNRKQAMAIIVSN